jgi:integrase
MTDYRSAQLVLAHLLYTFLGDKAPVFCSARGTPLNPSNLANRVLKPAAIEAGLLRPAEAWKDADKPESWVSFHTFRHTCGSLLDEAGRRAVQVQGWLGHHAPSFTQDTYMHSLDDGLGDADFLDDTVAVIEAGA